MKKKILSMALALCLAFGTAATLPDNIFTSGTGITASALQYGNFTYSLSNGGVTIEKYTGSEENVVIPKTIDGHTVTGIGTDSFYHCKTIKTVSIPDSVTYIGSAFDNCSNLESVNLPNGIKQLPGNLFYGCTALKSITIPASVERIASYAFSYCGKLTSLKVASGNKTYTSKDNVIYTKDMKTLILCAQGLTNDFVVPNGVKTIADRAFFSSNIKSVTFSSTVETIGEDAFCNTDLKSVNIPGTVKTIGDSAFYLVPLTNVTLNEGTQTVCRFAFAWTCISRIKVPKSVKKIGDMAFGYTHDPNIGSGWSVDPFFTLVCYADTSAHRYAMDNKIRREVIYESHDVTHSTKYHEAKKATCTEDGNIEYWSCSACHKYYSDALNKKEIKNQSSVIIPKTGHDWGEWQTTIEAKKNTDGQQQRVCKTCKEVQKRNYAYDASTSERIAGKNRYETAAAISKASYEYADTVVLAYGLNYADALAGGPLAAAMKAPILLTNTNSLPNVTVEEIKRLHAYKVVILGGEGVISTKVENQLKSISSTMKIERIAGANRYQTSVKIAEKIKDYNDFCRNAFYVSGTSFPDALSVSAIACQKLCPIIYVKPNGMDETLAEFIWNNRSFEDSYIIGGTGVISQSAAVDIESMGKRKTIYVSYDANVTRIAGKDRYETNAAVLNKFYSQETYDGRNLKNIYLATGCDFPDALVGGVLAGIKDSPLMLVNGKAKTLKLSDAQTKFLIDQRSKPVYALGGEGAVPDSHVNTILKEING